MSGTLIVHRSGWEATKADLAAVPVAVKGNIVSASRLPKVIEAWGEPKHEEFRPRTAWSLFNAFTEVQKGSGLRVQMEGSLRLSSLFRREPQLT